ncbi:MAG: DUF362 domain-containing protein [Candidatus Hermodarchaeota archaeon]
MRVRAFESKIDLLLKRIPTLGKLFSSIFGLFEFPLLEFLRRIDVKYGTYSMGIVDKYFLRGRWGGKIVPLNININLETKFLPTQEVVEILNRSNVAGIGWCYCRSVQRKYNEPNCNHPLYTCIHLGFGKSLYEIPHKSYNLKKVSKQEILELLEDCDKRGLIHQLIYFPSPQFYYIICNCCPCCCVVLNKFLKSGSPQIINSDFIAITDSNKCDGCGECESWCYFGARHISKNRLVFDSTKCFGCGICVSKCPNHAIKLELK